MNLTLDETHTDVGELAAGLLARRVTEERLSSVAAGGDRFDTDLWRELAATGLLGVGVADGAGGLGLGVVGAALVCREIGRVVAPVPYAAAATAAVVLAEHADPMQRDRLLPALCNGDSMTVVVPPLSVQRAVLDGDRLSGSLVGVPWAHVAHRLLVGVGDDVVLLDTGADGVTATRGETIGMEIALDLELDAVPVELVGGGAAGRLLREVWLTLLAATQAGVTDAAVRLTAAYTSSREQFGRPLSTNQAVALQAADAYVDATVIDALALQAAWLIDEGLDATPAVLTAAWWASEGGQHCVHLTQHLHGGMGADVTYPLHRYFLWGKQIELQCGAASRLLAELADALADRPTAGDALVL